MTIVERIKSECKKNNTNMTSIEKEIGLSNGAIGKWNNSKPSADNLYNVAQLLHCSMEYLLTGNDTLSELSSDKIEWLNLYNNLLQNAPTKKDECIDFIEWCIFKEKNKNPQADNP